ncbi:hypothetical protein QYM36_006523 [Artemia franciscana]|uniref:Ig-like domain-containing protein n=1 Tax=Artemia franciscana TaxID=6661 RepID=A0AA88I0I8_ARTSF|nr:hypothetical protein QYM36_006523 [Artemia franciscana]
MGLTNLIELDLGDNLLTSVPTGVLANLPALMRLILSRNTIQRIQSGAFKALKDLTTLELSQCEILEIEDGAFLGMKNLEWLKLDGNHIKTLNGQKVLPRSLHGIDLHGNPWNCDCKLSGLRNWLVESNVPNAIESKCSSPERLEGKLIRSINNIDFACYPEITPSSMFLEVAAGRNVSLTCKAHGDPIPRLLWYFKGEKLINTTNEYGHSWHLLNYSDDFEAKSELFLSESTDAENGTFTCVAINRAGSAESNFTLRIITKFEEPVTLPSSFNYVYVAVGAAIAFTLIAVLILVVIFWRCCCHKDRRKGVKNKNLIANESRDSTLSNLSSEKPVHIELKPNPDLINDTTSDSNWTVHNISINDIRWTPSGSSIPAQSQAYFKPLDLSSSDSGGAYGARACSSVSEEKHLDREGYPVDYGLPRPAKLDSRNPYTIQSVSNYPPEAMYSCSYGQVCLPDQKYFQTLSRMNVGSDVSSDSKYKQEIPLREEYVVYNQDVYPSPPEGYKTIYPSQTLVRQGTPQKVSKSHEHPGERPPHESPDEGYDESGDGTEI